MNISEEILLYIYHENDCYAGPRGGIRADDYDVSRFEFKKISQEREKGNGSLS